jgi:hypothetical protein
MGFFAAASVLVEEDLEEAVRDLAAELLSGDPIVGVQRGLAGRSREDGRA